MHKKVARIVRRILHVLESVIAVMTLIVLVGMLGLEFVRMLVDMTPANTLEVLIVAIARQVILNHEDPLSNVASIVCIAGLFATRRSLIPKKATKVELSEVEGRGPAEVWDPLVFLRRREPTKDLRILTTGRSPGCADPSARSARSG